MGAAILTFAAFFHPAVGCRLRAHFTGGATRRRLAVAVAEPSGFVLDAPPVEPGARVARIVEPFQRILPRSSAEVSVVQKRLIRAGYREKTYVNIFYGAKVLVAGLAVPSRRRSLESMRCSVFSSTSWRWGLGF